MLIILTNKNNFASFEAGESADTASAVKESSSCFDVNYLITKDLRC